MQRFKFSLILIFIVLAFQLACGQTNVTEKENAISTSNEDVRVQNLKNQANKLFEAFNKDDFDKFIDLTHPKVIEKVGGRERLISIMKSVAEDNPKIFETFSISVENPSDLSELNGILFGIVPQKLEGTTYRKHKIVQNGCVIGISEDNGKT